VLTALNIAHGASYQINGVNTLSATALGTAVVGSSLTSVGTLTDLDVAGAVTFDGAVTLGNAAADAITVSGKMTVAKGLQHTATTLGAAGAIQGAATAIVAGLSAVLVTSTGANQGVILPTASAGQRITMMRGTATNVVKVYPATGATINGAGANAALEMTAATEVMTCVGMSANAWQCVRHGAGAVISSRRRLSATSSESTDELNEIIAQQNTQISKQTARIEALERAVNALMKKVSA
jgi:hypothetical protein